MLTLKGALKKTKGREKTVFCMCVRVCVCRGVKQRERKACSYCKQGLT